MINLIASGNLLEWKKNNAMILNKSHTKKLKNMKVDKKHEKDGKKIGKSGENHENRINVRSQISANSHNSREFPLLLTQKASYFTIKTNAIDESRRTMYHQRCCFWASQVLLSVAMLWLMSLWFDGDGWSGRVWFTIDMCAILVRQ